MIEIRYITWAGDKFTFWRHKRDGGWSGFVGPFVIHYYP